MADGRAIDFAQIQDTSDGDMEFEHELFTAYVEDCLDRINRLREAAAKRDLESLRREAHTIKGASANVGTTHLHVIARELEGTDIANDGAIAELIARMEAEFERVRTAIGDYLGTP